MAWKAKMTGPVQPAGTNLGLSVVYYDDQQPTEILHAQSFTFPVSWTSTDMADAIRAEGQAARASAARAAALNAQFPVATTVINIP